MRLLPDWDDPADVALFALVVFYLFVFGVVCWFH